MNRSEYVLAVMASAGDALTPVQVQKLFFILDEKISPLVDGPHFRFAPYNYGPFDPGVYAELDDLASRGLVVVDPSARLRSYAITSSGLEAGMDLFGMLPDEVQTYVPKLVTWIRSLSFKELVSAVYNAWPSMKANSIFRG